MKKLVILLVILNALLVADRFLQVVTANARDGARGGIRDGAGAGGQSCSSEVGDVNASGEIDISDALSILGFLFLGDPVNLAPNCFAQGGVDLEQRVSELETAVTEIQSGVFLSDLACDEGQVPKFQGGVWTCGEDDTGSPPTPTGEVLRNDGFQDGGQAGFQQGFVANEEGAVSLGPTASPSRLENVQLLFGGSPATQTVTLIVYQELGSPTPGPILFEGDATLTGADDALQQIDLSASNILLPQGTQIRVSIRFNHSGLPSIARDADGSINASVNWINAEGIGWVQSNLLGLTGDWIIRATVAPVN